MASLLMLSPAPVVALAGGEVILDVKFVEGMKLHSQLWPGPVRCVLWRGHTEIDEPLRYSLQQLGFDLILQDPGTPVPQLLLDECSMVYCSADDMKHLDLPQAMRGRIGKLVYTVEQSLAGRMAAGIAQQAKVRRRIGSAVWNLRKERHLRRALRAADGVHCNGYPSRDAYSRLNPAPLFYLDNRMRTPMLARSAEQDARAERLRAGEPLRLAWFGMLTPESNALDYLPVAHLLTLRGVPFEMDIIGTGPLENRVRDGIAGLGLGRHVRLTHPEGFDARLVPRMRQNADLFLSARRLPTPLSSYVEALGCGLPILGYRNAMFRKLVRDSGAGWMSPRRTPGSMVRQIEWLDQNREAIIEASTKAVSFARANSFESVFARRMTHLRDLAHLD